MKATGALILALVLAGTAWRVLSSEDPLGPPPLTTAETPPADEPAPPGPAEPDPSLRAGPAAVAQSVPRGVPAGVPSSVPSSVPSGVPEAGPRATPDAEPVRANSQRQETPEPVDEAPAAEAPPPRDLSAELALLREAQAVLRTHPAGALALAETHLAQFPTGALGQEREVVAIEALLALGRTEEARTRAERFTSTWPGSAHQRRLDSLLSDPSR